MHDAAIPITLDLHELGPLACTYFRQALDGGLLHFRRGEWRTSRTAGPKELFPFATTGSMTSSSGGGVARVAGGLLFWTLARSSVEVRVAARTAEAAEDLVAHARELFPPAHVPDAQRVELSLWTAARGAGGHRHTRTIDVPRWEEIEDNYTAAVREALGALHATGVDGTDGRLLLWHGPPGTGKTHAIRSLGWAWRSWCDLHYVADPERLLGDRPDYLFDVLGHQQYDAEDRWSLLVLEDTGELLQADARERAGQGLSRFLNVLDGLLGQGTRTLVLLTTNEDVGTLHPAVVRPGRCASRIAFGPLTAAEAAAWRAAHGGGAADDGGATLAALFAAVRGQDAPVAPVPLVGFR